VVRGIGSVSGSEDTLRAWVLTIAAIRELTADQQDVLLLRLVGDLSLEEVARVVGKRLTAVKALQRRGLAALARRISREAVSL
jgi:DNA-directed RNA polymerase specialized sigma24 family protein